MSSGDFSFGDYTSTYTSPTIPTFPDPLNLQPIQPSPQSAYPSHVSHQPGYVPNTGTFPPQTQQRIGGSGVDVGVGEKRKAEHQAVPNSSNRMLSFEEQSRLAAEEDKRKRNTAASARFRVKKKQREQALEKSAKEMSDKVSMLETRISALETENKWLKSLVTEKHGGGKDDILKKLLKEFSSAQENGKSGSDQHSDNGDGISSRGSSISGGSSIASSITAAPAGSEDGSSNLLKRARKKE